MTDEAKVARAIYFSRYSGDYKPIPWVLDAAKDVMAALKRPDSMEVRDQMLCERYGSQRPRAQWDVT